MIGDEFLVGGDDALAGFKCTANPGAGWVETADQFNDDVDIGGKHGIGVFAPDEARGRPWNALAGDAAVEDVGQLQSLGL